MRSVGREISGAEKLLLLLLLLLSGTGFFGIHTHTHTHTHRRARVRGVMGLRRPRSLGYTRRLIYDVTKRAVMLQTPTRWFYRSIDRTVELALSYSPIGTRTEVYKKKNIAFFIN